MITNETIRDLKLKLYDTYSTNVRIVDAYIIETYYPNSFINTPKHYEREIVMDQDYDWIQYICEIVGSLRKLLSRRDDDSFYDSSIVVTFVTEEALSDFKNGRANSIDTQSVIIYYDINKKDFSVLGADIN